MARDEAIAAMKAFRRASSFQKASEFKEIQISAAARRPRLDAAGRIEFPDAKSRAVSAIAPFLGQLVEASAIDEILRAAGTRRLIPELKTAGVLLETPEGSGRRTYSVLPDAGARIAALGTMDVAWAPFHQSHTLQRQGHWSQTISRRARGLERCKECGGEFEEPATHATVVKCPVCAIAWERPSPVVFVYGLVDSAGAIRYVGRTVQKLRRRLEDHIIGSILDNSGASRCDHAKCKWILNASRLSIVALAVAGPTEDAAALETVFITGMRELSVLCGDEFYNRVGFIAPVGSPAAKEHMWDVLDRAGDVIKTELGSDRMERLMNRLYAPGALS